MSDDEEYYDEYDDEDIFWIEEPDPDIADDLAGTSTHDPTFQEDPSLEAVEFFSDWDELSDDYYDEDPTAVRRLRAMGGGWPHISSKPADQGPPAKRRKPYTPYTDIASFQGVVWKHPTDEVDFVELYAPGDGEKVSLLKNWREIFKDSKPAIGHLRLRKPGPLSVKGAIRGDVYAESSISDQSSAVEYFDDGDDDEVDACSVPTSPPKSQPSGPLHTSTVSNPQLLSAEYEAPGENRPKNKEVEETLESTPHNPTQIEYLIKEETKTPNTGSPLTNRKRKASVSFDYRPGEDGNDSTDSTSKPRSKRIASSKVGKETTIRPTASSGPVRRSTRNNK